MSDPSESNTGYITLMGVSYSIANTGENLKVSDIPKEKIEEFFKGNTVKTQGSYWLMEEFKNSKADFIINYESVLLTYNINNKNDELVLVYPDEGISSADYPLLLINPKKQEIYRNNLSIAEKNAEECKDTENVKWRKKIQEGDITNEGAVFKIVANQYVIQYQENGNLKYKTITNTNKLENFLINSACMKPVIDVMKNKN